MNRILSCAIVCICLVAMLTTSARAEKPFNVLFIAVDDLRPEMEMYGALPKTPNLNRLAKTSVQFDRAYCQQAVCGASRLSIMGGLYPTFTGEQSFHVQNWRQRHPDLLTMNQHFTNNGFRTIGLGKIYHGTSGAGVDPENWGHWIKVHKPDYALKENNEKKAEAQLNRKSGFPMGPMTESADVPDSTYCDGERAIKAAEMIDVLGKAKDEKPFFLAVGFTKPHLPFTAPKKYWDLYKRSEFMMPENRELPPGYLAHAANLPAWEMKNYSDYVGDSPKDFPNEMNQRLLHGYAACVSYMDANVGIVLDALKDAGLEENTIVVFWGDHGWKLGDHSSWCKHTNLECDTRVPLIVRVPGLNMRQTTKKEVELIDVYPTLCELTGIEIPSHCQGKSFKALLNNPYANHRDAAYSSYPTGRKEIGHSIRMGSVRYTQWHLKSDGSYTGQCVLTDLAKDPGEVTNVAGDAAYAGLLARAEKLLNARIEEALKN